MTADQRVRRQLVRLKPRQTSAAVARTRDATLTARSLDTRARERSAAATPTSCGAR